MTDAPTTTPTHITQTHLDWMDFRIPVEECERDADGALIPPSPLPDPIPFHWDADFDYARPRRWLWSRAWDALANFQTVHGEPQKVAGEVAWSARPYRLALDWLVHIELLLRRILLLAAGDYAGAFKPHTPRPRVRPATPPSHQTLDHRLAHASFSVPLFVRERHAPQPFLVAPMRDPHAPVDPKASTRRCPAPHEAEPGPMREPAPPWIKLAKFQIRAELLKRAGVSPMMIERKPPGLIGLTQPIALRFAACLRIFENPQPFVKRLARRMWREQHHHGRNSQREMRLVRFRGHDLETRTFGQRSISRCFPLIDWLAAEVVATFNAPLHPVPS